MWPSKLAAILINILRLDVIHMACWSKSTSYLVEIKSFSYHSLWRITVLSTNLNRVPNFDSPNFNLDAYKSIEWGRVEKSYSYKVGTSSQPADRGVNSKWKVLQGWLPSLESSRVKETIVNLLFADVKCKPKYLDFASHLLNSNAYWTLMRLNIFVFSHLLLKMRDQSPPYNICSSPN